MADSLRSLLARVWWSYDPTADWPSQLYRGFNLVEGAAWLAIAILVVVRYVRNRRTSMELVYAGTFVTFGLSDFAEAYQLSTGLILFKGVNLVALLLLRRVLLRRYYPQSRTF